MSLENKSKVTSTESKLREKQIKYQGKLSEKQLYEKYDSLKTLKYFNILLFSFLVINAIGKSIGMFDERFEFFNEAIMLSICLSAIYYAVGGEIKALNHKLAEKDEELSNIKKRLYALENNK